jgi:hypothetical protein
MMPRFPTAKTAPALSITELRKRLETARTFLMYGQNAKMRVQAMTTIESVRSELMRRGEAV